jgi:hypothetical protein
MRGNGTFELCSKSSGAEVVLSVTGYRTLCTLVLFLDLAGYCVISFDRLFLFFRSLDLPCKSEKKVCRIVG